jgi:hypothetical protein
LVAVDVCHGLGEVDDIRGGLKVGGKPPDQDRNDGHDHPEHQAA